MLEKITSFITGIMVAIGGFFTPTPVQDAPIEPAPIQEESFGAFSPVAGGTYRLKTSIGTSDTTIILSAFTEPITGNPLTMTSLATDIGYATIDPQSSTRKEFVSFTGITQNSDGSATLTGVSRGLGFQSPFTASSTLRKSHPGQSIFILSDSPQLFNEYARKRNNETITGQWTFSTFPITPSSSPATATTSGQVELATGGEAASSTLTGDSGASLALHTGISTSSAPASGNVVVVTGDDGKIDSGFLGADSSINRIVFDSNGTYTKSSRVKYVFVQVWGAGGSGGTRSDAEETGGGGGGGYVDGFIASSSLSATTSVFIGNGGASVSGNNNGNAGASSTFSSLVAWGGNYGCSGTTGAAGGAGGGASATSTACSAAVPGAAFDALAGAGGNGTGGTVGSSSYSGAGGGGSFNGSFVGGGGRAVYGGGGGGACAGGNGGIAGTSQFGGAGGAGCGGTGNVPGGGGGANISGASSGAGGKGRVIITEYF